MMLIVFPEVHWIYGVLWYFSSLKYMYMYTGCPSKFSIEKLRWITLTTKCIFTTHTYTKTTPNIFFPGLNHPCRTNTNNFRDLFFFRFCKMATWFYPHSELRITIKKSMRRLIDALRKIPLEKSNQEMFMSEQV